MTHSIEHIGLFVIFGIVMLPVYVMVAGWLVGKPRDYRSVGIGLASIVGLIIAMVVAVYIGGGIVSLIMGLS